MQRLWPWAIFAATLLVFSPVLEFGFLNWDDQTNFLRNPHFKGWSGENLRWIFTSFHLGVWQPLSWLLLDLEWTFWGMDPSFYHLVSLLLHGLNAVLVFFIAKKLLNVPKTGKISMEFAAVFGALFYALHPLRVEGVAWLSCQPYLLAVSFLLLSIIAYLKAAKEAPRKEPLIVSILFYALALMSKGIAITLPAALVVLDIYPLRRIPFQIRDGAAARKVILEKVPFFILSLAAAWAAAVGKSHGMRQWSEHGLIQRLAQMAFGGMLYLRKTILPIHLSPLYPLPAELNPFEPRFLLSALGILGITLLLLLYCRKWPSALASWVAFGVLIAPVLGFAQAGPQIAADRYTYLPGIVWGVFAGGLVLKWRMKSCFWSFMLKTGMTLLIMILAILSWWGTWVWKSSETVWKQALEIGPPSVTAYNNLGNALLEEGRYRESIEQFQKLIQQDPHHAEAYNNMGLAWQGMGRTENAIHFYEEAIRQNPAYSSPYNNLGILLSNQKRTREAISFYRQAMALQPENPETLCNLALALIAEHQFDQAIRDLQAVLKMDSHDQNALYALAWLRATGADPRLRNGKEALELARELCGLTQYENPQGLDALAAAYAELGMFPQARKSARMGIEWAQRLNQWTLASEIQRHLESYQKQIPWHSS